VSDTKRKMGRGEKLKQRNLRDNVEALIDKVTVKKEEKKKAG